MRVWSTLGVVLMVTVLTAPQATKAQEREAETLITGGIDSGGFGGPVLKFAEMDDRFGMFVGFRGGWIVDHTFVIGLGGYGLTNPGNFSELTPEPGLPGSRMYMGYGGLELEWVIASYEVVHLSLQTLIGGGGVGYEWDGYECCDSTTSDAFFIAEPGANIMLNVHKVFRLGLGASYRFIYDVELPPVNNDSLRGAAGVLTLKFGSF